MQPDFRPYFRILVISFGAWIAWFGVKGLVKGTFLIEDLQTPGRGTFPGQTYVDLQGSSAALPSVITVAVGLLLVVFALFLPLRRDDDEHPGEPKIKHKRSGKSKNPRHR